MMKEKTKNLPSVQKVDYEIMQTYKDNPQIKSILYSDRLYKFLVQQELSMLPIKIINVILSAVKQEQTPFIKRNETVVEAKQLSFDDFFQNWSENSRALFTISFKSIKLNKDIKNRDLFNSFIALSNLSWEIFSDEKNEVEELIPFLEGVKWTSNKVQRDRFIQFRMHRKTMESLLDMSRYLGLDSDFVMNLKSPKTFAFIFWSSKFIPHGGTKINIEKFCQEMNIPYTYDSKVAEYLQRIRAEMNSSTYAHGMNFSIVEDKIHIQLFDKKEGIGITKDIPTLEDLQIKRAIYHITKKRNLTKLESKEVEKIYRETGYENISKLIKRKIKKEAMGKEYIEELQNAIIKN